MNNICIGRNAGLGLTTETNIFCIMVDGVGEYRRKCTDEQLKVLNEVFTSCTVSDVITIDWPAND